MSGGAGAALEAAALAAIEGLGGIRAYAGPPIQASAPYATVEAGSESDWSHKSGEGRELRLAVALWDRGEHPSLRERIGQAEEALGAIGNTIEGWQLVTLQFLRTRLVPPKSGSPNGLWAAVIEYRARLLRG